MLNKCLTGIARSGKDTAGKILAKQLGMETYALAQPIKDIMCALFSWGEEHRDGSYKEIPMLYSISPESLEAAGDVYERYRLDTHEMFHDCFDKLAKLFQLELDIGRGLYFCVISPRKAFQLFGTEWGRSIQEDIWLDIAPKTGTIITDIRFNDEAEYFSVLGADLIKVERPGFKLVDNGHSSENGVSEHLVDYTIVNDKDLKAFEDAVWELGSKLT